MLSIDSEVKSDRRSLAILIGVIGVYLAAIIVLALLGRYTFVVKVLIVPSLFIVAALTRRLRLFVYDWAVFLALVALFDTLRGLIFQLTMILERPVFMNYAIDAERLLSFGRLPTAFLQNLLSDPPNIRFLEKFLIVVHGSHFLFFMFFALLVWYLRRNDFERFQVGMVLVMYGGLLGYFFVPTVPPWMAANEYQAIAPIFHFPAFVYNTTLPKLSAVFDTNPIAAMPSLHTAFPVYCTCVAFWLFGRRAIPMLIYAIVVVFALVYAGEHYLVDSLAGTTLAIAAWAVTHRLGPLASRLTGKTTAQHGKPLTHFNRRTVIAVIFLAAATIGGNRLGARHVQHTTGREFINRELIGKTSSGHYYMGLLLEQENQLILAQREYELAAAEMGTGATLGPDTYRRLGRVAHDNGDHELAAKILGVFSLNSITPTTAAMLGISLTKTGRLDEAVVLLQKVQQRLPGEPVTLYWLTRILAEDGRLSAEEIQRAAARIRAVADNSSSQEMAAQLDAMAAQQRLR